MGKFYPPENIDFNPALEPVLTVRQKSMEDFRQQQQQLFAWSFVIWYYFIYGNYRENIDL